MAILKLIEIITLKGKIQLLTGLHIGTGSSGVEIGGMDNPIIKHPFTDEPYIPGSSLKGKMRSLMEYKLVKEFDDKMNIHLCENPLCGICRVFGSTKNKEQENKNGNTEADHKIETRGPTRITVRDAHLTEDWIKKSKNSQIIEEKFENAIDRKTGTGGHPRQIERVASGVEFDFEISYSIFDTGDNGMNDRKNYKVVVLESLRILEQDRLGGYGSRGSGKIKFKSLEDSKEVKSEDLAGYIENEKISR